MNKGRGHFKNQLRRNVYKKGEIIAKLKFIDNNGTLEIIDQLTSSVNDKKKGIAMVFRIIRHFDLTSKDLEDEVFSRMMDNAVDYRLSPAERLREKINKPIHWNKY